MKKERINNERNWLASWGSSVWSISVNNSYIAKTLNTATKTIDRVNKIIDYNEKNINEIIDNAADITTDVKSILDIVEKVTGFFKILRVFKK